jgi:hypothetical protein
LNENADKSIRVLVVGESPIVRAGLGAAISESDRFEVAASAILMESGTFSSWTPKPAPVATGRWREQQTHR